MVYIATAEPNVLGHTKKMVLKPGRRLAAAPTAAANVVECCFQRPEQFRAITTRYDKTTESYRG